MPLHLDQIYSTDDTSLLVHVGSVNEKNRMEDCRCRGFKKMGTHSLCEINENVKL